MSNFYHHEAEPARNNVLGDFRHTGMLGCYSCDSRRQVFDINGLVLLAREVLGELQAAGLPLSRQSHLISELLETVFVSQPWLREEWAALLEYGAQQNVGGEIAGVSLSNPNGAPQSSDVQHHRNPEKEGMTGI